MEATDEGKASPANVISVKEFLKSFKQTEVMAHADKIEAAIPEVSGLLNTRTRGLKKIGVPCKQRKVILRYLEQYRQGRWSPSQL